MINWKIFQRKQRWPSCLCELRETTKPHIQPVSRPRFEPEASRIQVQELLLDEIVQFIITNWVYTYIHGAWPFSRNHNYIGWSRNFAFYGTQNSLPCSQQLSTDLYPEPDEPIPYSLTQAFLLLLIFTI
jgi:hypothetical protein